MKFRLVGKDFQSWKTFDLNVGGFTVIVGASNRGKSALIRALRGILRNQVSDAHIRKGEKSTEVAIVVDKGPTATLTRTKTTTYKVNGEDYAKLSGELPEPLKALNLHAIQVGGTKLDPVFASQFDSQFMMDLTPADLNNVLGLFSNTEQLNQGKKTINISNTEINSQAKLLASEVQTGNIRAAKMREIVKEFGKLKPTHDQARAARDSAETSKNLLHNRALATRSVRDYRSLAETPLPSLQEAEGWLSKGKQLRQLQRARILVSTGKQIKALPSVGKLTEAFTRQTNLQGYALLRKRLRAKPTEFKIAPAWGALQQISQGIREFKRTRNTVAASRLSLGANDTVLKGMHKELHDLEKDTITCPKCGYQFTEDSDGN